MKYVIDSIFNCFHSSQKEYLWKIVQLKTIFNDIFVCLLKSFYENNKDNKGLYFANCKKLFRQLINEHHLFEAGSIR